MSLARSDLSPPAPAGADPAADERLVTIEALGASGDGVATVDGERWHVPLALPGEAVRARPGPPTREGRRAAAVEIVTASSDRATPPCPHFGICGGCALQHVAPPAILAWKRGRVEAALARHGIEAPVEPVAAIPLASRRRLVVAAQRRDGRLVVGFRARQSHTVVGIETCIIARPALVAALASVARLAEQLSFAPKGAMITLLETRGGIDVAITEATIAPADRASLVAAAMAAGFARLSLGGEVLAVAREPVLNIPGPDPGSGIAVVPPPGGFAQASAEAEALLAAAVTEAVAGARNIADLFSGFGTFALRLARRAAVHAVEGDKAALAALAAAARRATGLKPVTTEQRDLVRRPLTAAELRRFDAVVFDPPRDGAAPQAKALAASGVPTIVAVSCNPTTLARDLAYLVGAGYRIERIAPVDQFPFTPHIEAVAVLHGGGRRR